MIGEIAQYIVLNLFIAFILGLAIGLMISRGRKERFTCINNSENENKTTEKCKFKINPIFNKSASLDYKPMVLSTSLKRDNLKKIKGVDENLEIALYDLGIYQFDQIANWNNKNCEWIENFLNLPNYVRANQWVEQAKILKTGRETTYSQKLLDDLNNKDEQINII